MDIFLCLIVLPVFNASGEILHVVAQIVVVDEGLRPGFPEVLNLPDGLGDLQIQDLFCLLELRADAPLR